MYYCDWVFFIGLRFQDFTDVKVFCSYLLARFTLTLKIVEIPFWLFLVLAFRIKKWEKWSCDVVAILRLVLQLRMYDNSCMIPSTSGFSALPCVLTWSDWSVFLIHDLRETKMAKNEDEPPTGGFLRPVSTSFSSVLRKKYLFGYYFVWRNQMASGIVKFDEIVKNLLTRERLYGFICAFQECFFLIKWKFPDIL